MMKQTVSRFLALLLSLALFASCSGNDPDSGTQDPSSAEAETVPDAGSSAETVPKESQPETAPAAFVSDYPKLTDYSWSLTGSDAVGVLTFSGGEAELLLCADGQNMKLSGPATVGDKTLTIGDTKIGWAVLASFCRLTVDGVGYSFVRCDDPDAAKGPIELIANTWKGDGATLSFEGSTARLTVEGGRSAAGSWELTAGKTLTILDDARGNSAENLALGSTATSSSVETPDFPPKLAVDGDFGTRFSSEYIDPSWVLLDLGKEKTVGAAVVYFEVACSADFSFEVSSDGKTFTEAASVTGNTSSGVENPVTVLFDKPYDCRYVRFNGLSRATSWGHSIYELELYEYIPGSAECGIEFDGEKINLTMDGKVYALTKQ